MGEPQATAGLLHTLRLPAQTLLAEPSLSSFSSLHWAGAGLEGIFPSRLRTAGAGSLEQSCLALPQRQLEMRYLDSSDAELGVASRPMLGIPQMAAPQDH